MGDRHEHGGKSSERFFDKNEILSHLPVAPGMTILDAGCGNGYMSKEFARITGPNGKVYSIDMFESSIAEFRQSNTFDNITISLADITKESTIPDSSVDLVYMSLVFHGLSDPQIASFTKEMIRILKPGGKLAIIEFLKKEMSYGPPLELRYKPQELVTKVPFVAENLFYIGEDHYLQLFKI